jgi:replication-associated recombination protein RarA
MKKLGFGRDYRYAHDEPEGYAAGERYLPDDLPDRRYYRPVPRGLELKIGEALARLRKSSMAPAAATDPTDKKLDLPGTPPRAKPPTGD